MKYLLIIAFMFCLVGCVEPDPMRVADAKVKAGQSDIAVSQSNAQISQAQQSDADARRAQELLQALQAQQAIVAAQAAQAQAQSQTAIVQSNNEALVMVADRFVEASRTDYRPLYAGMAAIVVIIIAYLLIAARRPARQPIAMPRLLPSPAGTQAWLMPDGSVRWRRLSDGRIKVLLPEDEMYSRLLTG